MVVCEKLCRLGAPRSLNRFVKPLQLLYAKQSAGIRKRPRQAQARTSLLYFIMSTPTRQLTLWCSFFFFSKMPTKIQICLLLSPRSSLLQFGFLTSPFLQFLPSKDNQVYVKYVCSFDSRDTSLIQSHQAPLFPKCLKCVLRKGAFFNPVNQC